MADAPTPPRSRPARHAAHVEGLAEVSLAGRAVAAFTLSASGVCKCGAGGGEPHSVQVWGAGMERARARARAHAARTRPPTSRLPRRPDRRLADRMP